MSSIDKDLARNTLDAIELICSMCDYTPEDVSGIDPCASCMVVKTADRMRRAQAGVSKYEYTVHFDYVMQISVNARSQEEADKKARIEFTDLAVSLPTTIGEADCTARDNRTFMEDGSGRVVDSVMTRWE